MKFNVRGKNIEITEAIKKYVETKLSKLNKYIKQEDVVANVIARVKGKDQTIEVTIPLPKLVVRGEASNKDLYASIDMVVEKIERQLLKNKSRLKQKNNKSHMENFVFEDELSSEELEQIVKRKSISIKPMSEEEAILQMDLLGHDFFVFKSIETNSTTVLYKRKSGDYGIIETE